MQQHLPPFLRSTPHSQWEYLYRYFAEAEENQTVVTSVKIQRAWLEATGEMRDLDAVRWYMYRYWRWFLFLEDSRVKPYRYSVKHIRDYPPDYFVQAHMEPNRMQYLVHFIRSIEIDKELRRQAVGRGQPRRPRPEAFPVQQSLGMDDLPQDEIQIDEHEEEEGPIQNDPESEFVPREPEVVIPIVDDGKQDGEEVVIPVIVLPESDTSILLVNAPIDREIPPTPSSSEDAASQPKPGFLSPRVIVGILVTVCVVAVAVYFFLIKQPR